MSSIVDAASKLGYDCSDAIIESSNICEVNIGQLMWCVVADATKLNSKRFYRVNVIKNWTNIYEYFYLSMAFNCEFMCFLCRKCFFHLLIGFWRDKAVEELII